jgi:O-antigen/teichoic acid export membrane protein
MSTAPEADAGVLAGEDLASRVVRGGLLRAVAYTVVNLLGLASSVVLLRHLGVADFGRYGTVVALVAIATGLADAGLNITGSRELSLLPPGEQRRRLMGALLGARLVLLVLAALCAIAFAIVAGYSSEMVAGTALVALGAILVGVQSTLTLPLVVQLRNGLLSVNEVLKQAVLVAGVLVLALAGAALLPFFAIQVVIGVVALLAVPFLVARADLAWPSLSMHDLRHLAFTALPVALAAVLTAFYVRMLIVMASLLTSEYETGLFVTSSRVLEMIGGLALLITGVILPVATVAARDDRPRTRYVLEHTTKLALVAGGLLALVVVVAARPIVVLLGGEEFAPAAPVLRLQAPVVMTVFLVYTWVSFLIADGRRRALVQCMLVGTSVLVVTGVPLITVFDANGAAAAALVADVVLAAVTLHAVRQVGDGRVGIQPGYLARFVAALAMGAGAAIMTAVLAPAVVAAAAAAAVFAGAALALRIVPAEIVALLPGR